MKTNFNNITTNIFTSTVKSFHRDDNCVSKNWFVKQSKGCSTCSIANTW